LDFQSAVYPELAKNLDFVRANHTSADLYIAHALEFATGESFVSICFSNWYLDDDRGDIPTRQVALNIHISVCLNPIFHREVPSKGDRRHRLDRPVHLHWSTQIQRVVRLD